MSIERLEQTGWYKVEPTSPQEITALFSIVDRDQRDAAVAEVSDDLRFHAAYNGLLTLANIALRANGYRAPNQMGHQRVIESLEYTLATETEEGCERWVRKIKSHSRKRNAASYDYAGGVSPQDLEQAIRDLPDLRARVERYLREVHPELFTA